MPPTEATTMESVVAEWFGCFEPKYLAEPNYNSPVAASIAGTKVVRTAEAAEAARHTKAIVDTIIEAATAYSTGWIAAARVPIGTMAIVIGWIAAASSASTIGWIVSCFDTVIALAAIRTKAVVRTAVKALVPVTAYPFAAIVDYSGFSWIDWWHVDNLDQDSAGLFVLGAIVAVEFKWPFESFLPGHRFVLPVD